MKKKKKFFLRKCSFLSLCNEQNKIEKIFGWMDKFKTKENQVIGKFVGEIEGKICEEFGLDIIKQQYLKFLKEI